MAEALKIETVQKKNQHLSIYSWSPLAADAVGRAVDISEFSDKCIHLFGAFNGASVAVYGSNDPQGLVELRDGTLFSVATTKWKLLTDTQGNNISGTTEKLKQIMENPIYICVVVTGGDGNTAISAVIIARKGHQ